MKLAVLSLGALLALAALLGSVSGAARFQFKRQAKQETAELLTAAGVSGQPIPKQVGPGLPPPVQRYFDFVGIAGARPPRWVLVRQRGQFRLAPGADWIPFSAEQDFTLSPPGFLWQAWMNFAPFVPLAIKDRYVRGEGHMLAKAGALLPVVDEHGPRLSEAALTRYLSEAVWFPHVLLDPRVHWSPVDENTARVTFTDKDLTVQGKCRFSSDGAMQSFHAQRYRATEDGKGVMTPWTTYYEAWDTCEGIRVPLRGTASWALPDGDFTYVKLKVTSCGYDLPWPRKRGSR